MEEKQELRLSVSKTKTFEQCRKQFHFSYILKMPRKEMSYHILGKFAHKVLEDFHQAYINGSILPHHKEMGLAFKAAQLEYGTKMTPEMTQECHAILGNYLRLLASGENRFNTVKNVLSAEKEFFLPISDQVILNGFIDKIQLDEDGILHVADYKTTEKGAKYLRKDAFQLITYAYTMLQEDPTIKKIRASYILLRHNFEYITFEFSADQILAVKDKYLAYAESIRNEKEYSATTSALCNFCDFLPLCSEGMAKVNGKVSTVHGAVGW